MKIHDIAILFFIFWGSISQCAAQKIAVKTNLLYGTYASSPNLETEFGISPRGTVGSGCWLQLVYIRSFILKQETGALAWLGRISLLDV